MSLIDRLKPLKTWVVLFAATIGLVHAGCSTDFSSPDNDNTPPTSGSDVIPPDPDNDTDSNDDPPYIPPATNDPEPGEVSIDAAPEFCCNPLAIEFEAKVGASTGQSAIESYEWDFGNGRTGSGESIKHIYGRPGLYLVELVVTHNDGSSQLATLVLQVGVSEPAPPDDSDTPPDQDEPPIDDPDVDPDSPDDAAFVNAHAGSDQTVHAGVTVTLNGSASTTDSADALSFSWRQVSGPVVSLASLSGVQTSFAAPTGYETATVLTFELTAFVEGSSDRDQVRVTVQPTTSDEEPNPDLPTTQQLVTWMAELPPLPKVHYSFPLHPTLIAEPVTPLLHQYVRLTRAISLSSQALDWQISTAVTVCDQVNDLHDGGLIATIAINHSPWHESFPSDLPPTYTGPEHDAEIETYRQRLTSIRSKIAALNASRGTSISVSAILLDTERFYVKEPHEAGAAEWNAAINAKYAPFFDIAKQLYPNAVVEWYGHGIQESQGATGWSPFPWFTFEEPADTLACSLYRVAELETMRETFRRTYDFAEDLGYSEVTPWVALGAGYRRDPVLFQVWQQNWDYDPVYSLLLGREMNQWWHATQPDRYAPWDAATAVVFYPAPFDPRSPAWGKHFIAYARGAAGRNDVP